MSQFKVGDMVIVEVREGHDREEWKGRIAEIKDYLIKVVFPNGYCQWVHEKRCRAVLHTE